MEKTPGGGESGAGETLAITTFFRATRAIQDSAPLRGTDGRKGFSVLVISI